MPDLDTLCLVQKRCPKCEEDKNLNEFGKDSAYEDGCSVYCLECKRAYNRQYYQDNAERKNALRRQERKENIEEFRQLDRERYKRNRERILERQASYYAANPELQKARSRERYRNDPEAAKAAAIAWRKANPKRAAETHRMTQQTRRARKLGQFVEKVDPRVVYVRDKGLCGICGTTVYGKFHIDHVIPLARGGEHGYANTQIAHPECNLSKGAKVGG
jgi:5-methylcytosine-specific restriction endonuclease McrA